MWFLSSRKTRRTKPAGRSPASRLRLEVLEERCLLSAGALDPTFGNGDGYVSTALNAYGAVARAVLVQPWDGKIVVAGDAGTAHGSGVMGLARYNADGSLDSTFGSGGKVVSKIGAPSYYDAAALYLHWGTANDGKIVEADGGTVARFNPNGSTDTTFGSKGTVTVPWTIAGVVVQPDGKIVAGGDNGSAFELARFNANGTLDTSFGSGGTATLSLGSSGGYAEALALQADKLVVAGENGPGGALRTAWELARFNANGTLDTTFDSAGAVPGTITTSFGTDLGVLRGLAIYPSTGQIVAAGSINGNPSGINSNQVALARFNADGTLDSTFGQSGQVITPFPNGGGMGWATALQADGKIVVAGQTVSVPSGHWWFSLLRYNTNGSLDTTFGNGGLVVTPNGIGDSRAYGVAIQGDGKIVAAGSTYGSTSNGDFMVARYLPSEPEIGSFTGNPNPVTAGSGMTLTASNITDSNPNSSVTQVAFYVDSNGDGKLDTGDALLGYGTQTSPGVWTNTFTVSLTPGTYTLFAQAEDSDGIFGDPLALSLQVS